MEWRDASEMIKTNDPNVIAREMADHSPRKNPVLPFKGEHGILTRYLSKDVVSQGKGVLEAYKHLKVFDYDVEESIAHAGVENTETGIYHDSDHDIPYKLFVNMGCGAIIFEGLPKNNDRILVNYYGDTLGFRDLDITPFPIASEFLRDLNEAFKMMQKYAQ